MKEKKEMITENKFYSVGKWRGLDNFECKHCPFATLEKRDMTKHLEVHIRGNPELAGMKLPEEDLPEASEDHGLSTYDRKKIYQGPKKGKGKKGEK